MVVAFISGNKSAQPIPKANTVREPHPQPPGAKRGQLLCHVIYIPVTSFLTDGMIFVAESALADTGEVRAP